MSNIHLYTFYLASSVIGGTSWGKSSWTQALEVDQHTLQSLKACI